MRIYEITPGQRKPIKIQLNTAEKFGEFWDKTIEPNCSEVLKVYREVGKVYLRGEKGMPDIFRGASRINRPARDSNALIAQMFDNCLLDLGFDARRSNSIFATGSRSNASEFGNIYMIFPINGFKFTYVNVEDIVFDSFRDILNPETYKLIQDRFYPFAQSKNMQYAWQDWSRYYLKKPKSLEEIIAELKKDLPDDKFIQSLQPSSLIDCDYIERRYQLNDNNLAHALQNDFETLIKGSYYALAFDTYFKLANTKLGFLIKQ